jgi:hypothetical protein
MSCATRAQLAANTVDAEHLGDCLACRRALDEQRAIRAQLAALSTPSLDRARRHGLAAEVMARADLHDDTRRHRSRRVAPYFLAALAAAAVLVVLAREDRGGLAPRIAERAAPIPRSEPAPIAPAVAVEVTPRPRPSPAPEVIAPEAPVEAPPAPKHNRVDRSRHVFGGAADTQTPPIDRDTLVESSPLAAFRLGWEALRTKRYDEAIAAFDLATDPAVAEDAAFWAAIAAQRAGYNDDARKRLDGFLSLFPESPLVERARRAREVLR